METVRVRRRAVDLGGFLLGLVVAWAKAVGANRNSSQNSAANSSLRSGTRGPQNSGYSTANGGYSSVSRYP